MSAALPLAIPRATERDMLRLLRARYDERRTGLPGLRRYVIAEHVPSSVGGQPIGGLRIADFLALDTYLAQRPRQPDRYEIHGHEVKVSRSDWLAELRHPEKAEAFLPYMHRWWLVVPDMSIVRRDEVPAQWGVLSAETGHLRVAVRAPLLDPAPMPNGMTAAIARAAVKTAVAERDGVTP